MEGNVSSFIKKHHLISKGDTIVVGVSGGPDSLALLDYLVKISRKENLKIIAAHLNHMFRGEEAKKDCDYVKHFCNSIGISIIAEKIDVPAYQREYHLNAQEAARQCRYQFFEQVMHTYGANKLALAHHGDDQIETVLMGIARGSVNALKGMPVRRSFSSGEIIRPLLTTTKDEIEDYCKRMELEPRRDLSNEKMVYTRNRFRKVLLPFLKEENPNIHHNIQYITEITEAENNYLDELASNQMEAVILEQTSGKCIFDLKAFRMLSVPLQRRGIHLILKYLYQDTIRAYASIHIEDILALCRRSTPSGEIELPKQLRVIRSYDRCIVTFHKTEERNFYYKLSIPDHIIEDNAFDIRVFKECQEQEMKSDDIIRIPMSIPLPLIVRNRQPGDKMHVFADGKMKKVSRIFIDAKIPHLMRDRWPIVTDGLGRIVWIPGIKKAYPLTAFHSEEEAYVLTFRSYMSEV